MEFDSATNELIRVEGEIKLYLEGYNIYKGFIGNLLYSFYPDKAEVDKQREDYVNEITNADICRLDFDYITNWDNFDEEVAGGEIAVMQLLGAEGDGPEFEICSEPIYLKFANRFADTMLLVAQTRDNFHSYILDQGFERGVLINSDEEEADEVGLEFLLRAGIDPNYILDIYHHFYDELEFEKPVPGFVFEDACLTMLDYDSSAREVLRMEASHPQHCWRLLNLLKDEMRDHAEEYRPLLENAKAVNFIKTPQQAGEVNTLSLVKVEVQKIKDALTALEEQKKLTKKKIYSPQ